jgi:hypothetical protein
MSFRPRLPGEMAGRGVTGTAAQPILLLYLLLNLNLPGLQIKNKITNKNRLGERQLQITTAGRLIPSRAGPRCETYGT